MPAAHTRPPHGGQAGIPPQVAGLAHLLGEVVFQLQAVDKSRDLSGREVEDKFVLLGLEPLPATRVQAPLVAGCHASVECRVVSDFFTEGLHLFVGEALAVHVDHQLPPVGRLVGKTYRLGNPI